MHYTEPHYTALLLEEKMAPLPGARQGLGPTRQPRRELCVVFQARWRRLSDLDAATCSHGPLVQDLRQGNSFVGDCGFLEDCDRDMDHCQNTITQQYYDECTRVLGLVIENVNATYCCASLPDCAETMA